MKRRYIWIVITVIVLSLIGLYIYASQVVYSVQVPLFRNVFVDTGIEDETKEVRIPFEIMLNTFSADTTRQGKDGYYIAKIFLKDYGKNVITEKVLHPYDVVTYNNYNLYLYSYSYNGETDRLLCLLTVERRRYQTWFVDKDKKKK